VPFDDFQEFSDELDGNEDATPPDWFVSAQETCHAEGATTSS
jgi:hypothetical protein